MIVINTALWAWPQWTLLFLEALTLIGYCGLHGKPRVDYNFAHGIINFAITMGLLVFGGVFS
ncbi:hypothetical protein LJR231_003482 [Phyllobacterium sp. LjRoot231]|uniref:hypothetical protein n=1 Tax=Phyllobacterium sp. LjRoot231 TaxID=3342289 RepID=UPI003ECFB3D4